MTELLHKAIFAFISGFSELIFASPAAHQLLYRTVTGCELTDNLLLLGIHLGCLVALITNCRKRIAHLRNEKKLERFGRRGRGRQPDIAALMDIRILNAMVIPVFLGFLVYRRVSELGSTLLWLTFALVLNGFVLCLPRIFGSGNKNGRSFSQFDSFLMGLGGALGVVPGFSRLGCIYSVGVARGSSKNYALELSILMSIPAVAAMICFDIYGCAVASTAMTGLQLIGALVALLTSFCGTYLGVALVRFICNRSTTVGFAYYSWGLAMFLLLIYLFVV